MAFQGLCDVSNAGVTPDGRAAILLKSPAFPTGRNFKSSAELTRESLAVALAAIASNKQVYCDIPAEGVEWSDISQINLISGR